MSHFTVLVPANDEQDLFDKLLPYYEYGCSRERDELVRPFLVFETQYEAGEFERAAKDILDGLDGTEDYYDEYQQHIASGDYEAVLSSWEGGEIHPETGAWGYWHNPNDKWDWYVIGGRWTGLLHLRNGASGGSGTPGLMTEPNADPSRADIARAGDVDWNSMRKERRQKAEADWQAYIAEYGRLYAAIAILTYNVGWPIAARLRQTMKYRDIAGAILGRIKPKTATKNAHFDLGITPGDWKARHMQRRSGALTWAFIDLDGQWNEKADMGWWGLSSGYRSRYARDFWQFVNTLPPEQWIYVVDCHI